MILTLFGDNVIRWQTSSGTVVIMQGRNLLHPEEIPDRHIGMGGLSRRLQMTDVQNGLFGFPKTPSLACEDKVLNIPTARDIMGNLHGFLGTQWL